MMGKRGVLFVILSLLILSFLYGCSGQNEIGKGDVAVEVSETAGSGEQVDPPELTDTSEPLDEEKYSGEQANFFAKILNKIREKLSSD